MASTAVLVCFLILHCINADDSQCGHLQYTTIRNIRRSAAYNATSDLCDRGFIKDGSWYRFESRPGNSIKMPEFNPGINHCGTFIPIWMQGRHPTTSGVEVNRTACAPVPWLFPPGCSDKFDIKVINCGSFFLYQLKEPKQCTYAYCTENQPPQFVTPNSVYAVLNNDFEIKIVAVDPENQTVTFKLLSNGTLNEARMSTEMLTISNLKENGTVYVQVQDEMGANNVLILHLNAFECPCVHNGKCYLNKTIVYPVQPSDYLCQCEDPYSGQRCEIFPRPNPCDELPCYPGLNCYTAQNSEGFTCEECPTLFQGDGKQCELKLAEEKSLVASELTLTDQKWDDQLKIKTSNVYKNLVSLLTIEIRNIYKNNAGFSYVIIKGFRRGSIIVDFELIFAKKKVEDPLKPLMKVIETGKLGNMTVKAKIPGETKDDSGEDKILCLDRTMLFVIVGVAAVFILMIIVAIYLCIKRHRIRREAKLGTRMLSTSDKKPQEIAFQPTGQNSGKKEIDLNVFDNEAIHLEKNIKIQP